MNTLIQKIEQNEIFKFIKENFSLIIFVPSLLGGLRQFIILLFYSPTLIQYFSFTQIAIDGLETIFQVIFMICTAIFFYKVVLKNIRNFLAKKILMLFFLLLYSGILFYFNGFQIIETTYNLSTFTSYLLKSLSLVLLSLILADSYDTSINAQIYSSNKMKMALKLMTVVTILYAVFYIVMIKPFQYNVENVTNLTKNAREKFSKKAELIYYNDTYLVFIKNPDDELDERRFYVQKFETLFEEGKALDKK